MTLRHLSIEKVRRRQASFVIASDATQRQHPPANQLQAQSDSAKQNSDTIPQLIESALSGKQRLQNR
jgi:hypothetical protein